MKAQRKRQWLVWGALALTLAATAWVAASDEGAVEAVKPQRSTVPVAADNKAADELAYQPRAAIEGEPEELFPGDAVEEEAVQALTPPPKPTVPPIPFSYAGKLVEGETTTVFLTYGQRNLALHAGDVIDGIWRIESIRPPTMLLAYLPLKTTVPMAIGEKN